MIHLIENYDCNLDDTNKYGNDAVLRAASGGDVDLVRTLIDDFACNPNAANSNKDNAVCALRGWRDGGWVSLVFGLCAEVRVACVFTRFLV